MIILMTRLDIESDFSHGAEHWVEWKGNPNSFTKYAYSAEENVGLVYIGF